MKIHVCKACGGEFQPIQDGGTKYFHVCPPSVKELHRRDENTPSTDEGHRGKIKRHGKGVRVKGE